MSKVRKRFLITADVSLYKRLRKVLVDEEKSVSAWFDERVREYLKQRKRKN